MPHGKATIYITRQVMMTLAVLAVGIVCVFYGVKSCYRESRCLSLEQLSAGGCREGKYVAGTVEKCVTITVDGKVLGQSNAYSPSVLKTYYFYTIPMNDGKYIRLMLADEDMVDEVEKLIAKETEGVRVEGQISREPVPPNVAWYEQSGQIQNPQQDVIAGLVVKQISFKKRREILYTGIIMLVMAGLYLWQSGLIREALDSGQEQKHR